MRGVTKPVTLKAESGTWRSRAAALTNEGDSAGQEAHDVLFQFKADAVGRTRSHASMAESGEPDHRMPGIPGLVHLRADGGSIRLAAGR